MLLDQGRVQIANCIVVWDGVTRPEENDSGNLKWNVKVLIDPNNPDLADLHNAANQELQAGDFKGVLPNNGLMPIGSPNPADKWHHLYPNHFVVNASTFRQPQVVNEQGAPIPPAQLANYIYNGQLITVIGFCNTYNNVSKGVAFRLDGFAIQTSANAPRIEIGGSGFNVAGAFGGSPQQQAPQQGGFQQQAPQQGGFQQQAPQQQAPHQQAPQQQAPQQQAPQQGGFQQQAPQQQAPQQQAPQQAHNFMPQ